MAAAGALLACSSGPSPPLPAADAEEVQPARTVPQGQGGITITISRRSGGLASRVALDLGGIELQVAPGSSDGRLVLLASVPHGLAPGKKTLAVATAAGSWTVPDLVEVTALFAAPGGADSSLGSATQPFRTLKRALQAAGPGDTVQLMDGTYDAAAGETWDYAVPRELTIVGQSTSGTRLQGPAVAGAAGPAVTSSGLQAASRLVLRRLTLAGFNHAVQQPASGLLTLEDVDLVDHLGDALVVAAPDATVTIKGGVVRSARDGIALHETCARCRLELDGTVVTAGDDNNHAVAVSGRGGDVGSRISTTGATFRGGLFIDDGTATVTVAGGSITETHVNNGIFFRGTELQVTGTTITVTTTGYGIQLEKGSLVLSGVTIDGGTYGIYHNAGRARLRGTTIKNFGFVGYYLATEDLDLGTSSETGGNVFDAPATGYGLYIARLGQANPVTSSNTSFNGVVPPPGDVIGAIDDKPRLFVNTGEVVSFFVR